MNNKVTVLQEMSSSKLIAVLRSDSVEKAEKTAEACVKGGIRLIEITFSVPNADDVIKNLVAAHQGQNVIVGAGTVLDVQTARAAIIAGARFVVAPNFDKDTAVLCNRYSVPYIPGCMTVNEILHAVECGCDIIKMFPASQFGYEFIRAVNAPLPDVRFLVTGGIGVSNLSEWIKAGAVCAGIGGNLTTVKDGNYDQVTKLAQQYCQIISESR